MRVLIIILSYIIVLLNKRHENRIFCGEVTIMPIRMSLLSVYLLLSIGVHSTIGYGLIRLCNRPFLNIYRCSIKSTFSGAELASMLELGQSYRLPLFFDTFRSVDDPIQGVFAIESHDGKVLFVDSSLDIYGDISSLSKDTTLGGLAFQVRVQAFRTPNTEAMDAYRDELIRQTGPAHPPRRAKSTSHQSNSSDVLMPEGYSVGEAGDRISAPFDGATPFTDRITGVSGEPSRVIVSPFANEGMANGQSEDNAFSVTHPQSMEAVTGTDTDNSFNSHGSGRSPPLDLTAENVDSILNEVRPFLIADGGNVAVVEVDPKERSIKLALQGACGSCPSSTVRGLARHKPTLNLQSWLIAI